VHPGSTALGGAALTHGFEIAFYVLAAVAVLGAVIAALLVESKPAAPEEVAVDQDLVSVELAA
jgi:hypothetical protein